MRIAVTGASGFIGQSLTTVLRAAGHEPHPVNLRAPAFPVLQGVDAVAHLAGIAHRRAAASELRRVNVDLAHQVGRAAAACGAHMVFVSSVKVHGEHAEAPLQERSPIAPNDAYAASKAQAEEALQTIAGLRLTVLRPPLVYGPAVKANFLTLMNAVARGVPLPLASISNRRSTMYVGNLAHAILRCVLESRVGTYLACDGAPVSTPQLCRAIGRALGRPARLFAFPPALLPLRSLTASLELDDAAIRRDLGWRPPFSLDQALRATADWYRGR